MENNLSQEMASDMMAREAFDAVKKDKMSVAEKYARKYGTTDGEASEEELNELIKRFPDFQGS